MKGKRSQLPFDTRPMENAGVYRGSGLKGKTGKKKGGYTDVTARRSKNVGKPPSKMN
jgi:hypothetical protein